MKIFLILLVTIGAGRALAFDPNALENLTLEITLVDEGPATPESLGIDYLYRNSCSNPGAERFDINELISLGQQIWQIVKDGEPTLDFTSNSSSAIPAGAVCPFYMAGWSIPQARTYKMTYKNGFGMEVINFGYKLIYSSGGSYNGKGAYLANVSIHPADIAVLWGFSFDATVSIGNVLNIGSVDNPVAGMEIVLEWNIKNVVNKQKSRRVYFVDGSGTVTEL